LLVRIGYVDENEVSWPTDATSTSGENDYHMLLLVVNRISPEAIRFLLMIPWYKGEGDMELLGESRDINLIKEEDVTMSRYPFESGVDGLDETSEPLPDNVVILARCVGGLGQHLAINVETGKM
jgi:hypothetical protein